MKFTETTQGRHVAGPVGPREYRAEIVELDDGRHRLTSSLAGQPLDQTTWPQLPDAQARAEVELGIVVRFAEVLLDPTPRIIAGGREPDETCEALTTGCRIDHDAEQERDGGDSVTDCEVWR